MIEVLNYIYKKYPLLLETYPRWILLSFLDRNPDKIIIEKEYGVIKGIAIFLEIDDDSLLDIINGDINIVNPTDITELLNKKGDNIHFILCATDSMKYILRGLRKVIKQKNPLSISWWKPDMSKVSFIKMKGELCHKQY